MPVAPSMASRRMSACPAWRETSYSVLWVAELGAPEPAASGLQNYTMC